MIKAQGLIVLHKQGDVTIAEFRCRVFDEGVRGEVQDRLYDLISTTKPKLLLDFSAVDHVCAAGLGFLINLNNRMRERQGKLRLCGIKPGILEALEITKLDKLFKIDADREQALKSFQ
jgi:anti-anti-sigma factor